MLSLLLPEASICNCLVTVTKTLKSLLASTQIGTLITFWTMHNMTEHFKGNDFPFKQDGIHNKTQCRYNFRYFGAKICGIFIALSQWKMLKTEVCC